ncbi:MAG TPA: ABC transporter permease [Firmicutes bacterium]|nr:ABC transporter permease [Bacillota bacterium]
MQKTSAFRRFLRDKSALLLIILIVLTLITMVISSGVLDGEPLSALFTKGFMASGNLINIFYNLVIQCLMMCGIGLILISGNIDLSVAGQATLSTMVFAWLCQKTAMPWPVALLICLALAVVFGLVNTLLVNGLKFPSFIATIGMASIYRGLCNVMTMGNNIQVARQGFLKLGTANLFGILPATFLFAIVLVAFYQFVLTKTTFGRSVYMAGGNPAAARLSGLNPNKIRMILFINNSILAALGGLLWTAQIKLASPTAIISAAPDLSVISASILGGISFMGGAGHLGGALVALLLLNVFDNMLTVIGVQSYWNVFAQGLLLAVALIIDHINAERRRKALLYAEKHAGEAHTQAA